MDKKNDIRVIKTKRNIHNAYFELARKMDVHKISVRDICDLAECGRSTFYLYYPYKDALYREIVDTVLQDIVTGFNPLPEFIPGSWKDTSEAYLHNMVAGLCRVKSLYPLLPPGSEMYNTFVMNLIDQMVNYINNMTIRFLHIDSEWEKQVISAHTRVTFAGIINEILFCYAYSDYTVEVIQDLIRPTFMSHNEELFKINEGEE